MLELLTIDNHFAQLYQSNGNCVYLLQEVEGVKYPHSPYLLPCFALVVGFCAFLVASLYIYENSVQASFSF